MNARKTKRSSPFQVWTFEGVQNGSESGHIGSKLGFKVRILSNSDAEQDKRGNEYSRDFLSFGKRSGSQDFQRDMMSFGKRNAVPTFDQFLVRVFQSEYEYFLILYVCRWYHKQWNTRHYSLYYLEKDFIFKKLYVSGK